MPDDRTVLTADEAISLLHDEGDYIHNFKQGGFMMLGCDYTRENAIQAIRDAIEIEIGGEACKAMKHPLAVWKTDTNVSFFEADMDKVTAFEQARASK
jgi:hypothetical protein